MGVSVTKGKIARIGCALLACISPVLFSLNVSAADGKGMGYIFPARYNEYTDTFVSSQTTFLNGMWFTVDTYHDRILYNDTLELGSNLLTWKVMADDLNKPHAICSDGVIYLVVDTDNGRVVTYTKLATGSKEA